MYGWRGGDLLFLLPPESKKVPQRVSSGPPGRTAGPRGFGREAEGQRVGDGKNWGEGRFLRGAGRWVGSLIFASTHPSFFGKH